MSRRRWRARHGTASGTHLGMKFLAEIILFIKNLPGMLLRVLIGAVVVSLFLMFVYSYSNEGSRVREGVESFGETVAKHLPDFPGAGSAPDGSANAPDEPARNPDGPAEESPSEDAVVRPMGDPSESAWIASAPSTLDADKLASLNVEEPYAPYDYDRDYFGQAWSDANRNGCDTRNDVLARDLEDVVTEDNGCVVVSGTFGDPYTGQILQFTKGSTSSVIDIEHVVALDDAWDSGAWEWTEEERLAYANDPLVLAVVDGPTNRGKGSDPIGQWTPPYEGSQCAYGSQYLEIVAKYDLTVSDEDFRALSKLHKECV